MVHEPRDLFHHSPAFPAEFGGGMPKDVDPGGYKAGFLQMAEELGIERAARDAPEGVGGTHDLKGAVACPATIGSRAVRGASSTPTPL